MNEINLWLMAGGYLRTADGRYRWLDDLEWIARLMLAAQVRCEWGQTPGNRAACCYTRERRIVLAPWLPRCEADAVRDVLLHELAHVCVGRNCERARQWQQWWQPARA